MAKAVGLDITKKADKPQVSSLLKGWLGMGSPPHRGGQLGVPNLHNLCPTKIEHGGTSLAMRRRCDRAATDDPAAKRARWTA